jgi:hypothetical protein
MALDLTKCTRDIFRTFDISGILEKHNSSLSEDADAYAMPIDNNKVGKFTVPKTGWGALISVQVDKERDNVSSKIWKVLEDKNDEIKQIISKELDSQNIQYRLEDLTYAKESSWSQGSKTIYLKIWTYTKNGSESKNPIWFAIAFKGLKQKRGDPHELMTATLIAMGKEIEVSSFNRLPLDQRESEYEKLTEEIYNNAQKVSGMSSKERDLIKGDFVNLAKALSVSNYVIKLLKKKGYTIEKVYQTGAKWDSEIQSFKGGGKKDKYKEIIKAYNSSDLIIKFCNQNRTHYWGLSLKKKGVGIKEPDPTLLNKPIVGEGKGKSPGYLFAKIDQAGKDKLNKSEKDFYTKVYKAAFGTNPPTSGDWRNTWLKKLDSRLSDKEKNAALTGKEYRTPNGVVKYPKNTYFETIDEVFKETFKQPEVFKEFLDVAFRINIDSYVNQENFHFSLITGSGDLTKDGKLLVKYPDEKTSTFMNEVFTLLFDKGPGGRKKIGPNDFHVVQTRGKKQAFETGSTAAKLFYTMKIGGGSVNSGLPIVDLEVRYKGPLTMNPQFQVFITTTFKRYLNSQKQKLGRMHGF